MIKVKVYNHTRSAFSEAELCPSSGMIKFSSGEYSHIISEKNAGKYVQEIVEVVKPVELEEVIETKTIAPSLERSAKPKKKK